MLLSLGDHCYKSLNDRATERQGGKWESKDKVLLHLKAFLYCHVSDILLLFTSHIIINTSSYFLSCFGFPLSFSLSLSLLVFTSKNLKQRKCRVPT